MMSSSLTTLVPMTSHPLEAKYSTEFLIYLLSLKEEEIKSLNNYLVKVQNKKIKQRQDPKVSLTKIFRNMFLMHIFSSNYVLKIFTAKIDFVKPFF